MKDLKKKNLYFWKKTGECLTKFRSWLIFFSMLLMVCCSELRWQILISYRLDTLSRKDYILVSGNYKTLISLRIFQNVLTFLLIAMTSIQVWIETKVGNPPIKFGSEGKINSWVYKKWEQCC
jgi:hypothetical protein